MPQTFNILMISVCVRVMSSGEYDFCDVTLHECASTPSKLKSLSYYAGNRTRDLWDTSQISHAEIIISS
jgi:hypothetical protein